MMSAAAASTPAGLRRESESITNPMLGEDDEEAEGRELAQQLMMANEANEADEEKAPEIDSGKYS